MELEILKRNINDVIHQPCKAKYPERIEEDGICKVRNYIFVQIYPDDTSWQCNLTEDFVERIIEMLPEKYKDKLVTLKHDNWVYYSYVPVFDTDTQKMWDEAKRNYIEAKMKDCERFGSE